jgi:hypothetical protein
MQLSNDEISTGIFAVKQAILSNYKMLKDIENLSIPDVASDLRKEIDELKKVVEFLQSQLTIGEPQNAN